MYLCSTLITPGTKTDLQALPLFPSNNPVRWARRELNPHVQQPSVANVEQGTLQSSYMQTVAQLPNFDRIQSVKAVRYQIGEFYDAFFEISEISEDQQIKSEAESLGNAMKDYKFLVSLVFWYDLLFQVNYVSKELQSKSVEVSIALSSFEKLLKWLSDYRNTGFKQVLVQAKILAQDLEISTEFRNKRLRKRKKHFNYEGDDEPIVDPINAYKISFLNFVLDKATESLKDRFE